jgi:hypothetical protein
MQAPFPYQAVYFRRPFLTDENKRLWSILTFTTAIVLILHGILTHWSSNISPGEVRAEIKRNYISFLAQNVSRGETISPVVPPTTSESVFESSSSQFSQMGPAVRKDLEMRFTPTDVPQDITALVEQTDQLGFATISAAVEGVPGFAGRDFGSSRPEKKLYYRNETKIFRSHQEHIHIPIPETIQFASQNGNRNLDETIAIMETNENDIKYCFEKIARFDPSISGDVLLSFSIHPDGFVIPASVRVLKSSVRDPRIINCIQKQIRRWRNFTPLAYEDGNFSVTRKYVF